MPVYGGVRVKWGSEGRSSGAGFDLLLTGSP